MLRIVFAGALCAVLTGTLVGQTNPPGPTPAPPPATPQVPDNLVFEPDVVFGKGGTRDLHAEIAYPRNASKPTPAVIYIHGGGWVIGDLESHDRVCR